MAEEDLGPVRKTKDARCLFLKFAPKGPAPPKNVAPVSSSLMGVAGFCSSPRYANMFCVTRPPDSPLPSWLAGAAPGLRSASKSRPKGLSTSKMALHAVHWKRFDGAPLKRDSSYWKRDEHKGHVTIIGTPVWNARGAASTSRCLILPWQVRLQPVAGGERSLRPLVPPLATGKFFPSLLSLPFPSLKEAEIRFHGCSGGNGKIGHRRRYRMVYG